MTWTQSKATQHERLMREICPNNRSAFPSLGISPRHGVVAVTSRTWCDLFRKRRYWRCWFRDLREEISE